MIVCGVIGYIINTVGSVLVRHKSLYKRKTEGIKMIIMKQYGKSISSSDWVHI